MIQQDGAINVQGEHAHIIQKLYNNDGDFMETPTKQGPDAPVIIKNPPTNNVHNGIEDTEEFVEESLSLEDKEIELIKKALDKYNGKRKYAAQELGISERTLYRKIKEYNIN